MLSGPGSAGIRRRTVMSLPSAIPSSAETSSATGRALDR